MRSNERLTQTPSSRSAVSGVERGVGLDEAEHRREARRDHPGALACAGRRTAPPTAARPRGRRASRPASVVRIACGSRRRRRPQRVGAACSAGERPRRRGSSHADHAGRGEPRPGRRRCPSASRGGRLRAPAPSSSPRSPVGGVGVAGVGEHRAQRVEVAALAVTSDRRAAARESREARGADGRLGVGDQQPDVERRPSAALDPRGDARGAEALRQPGRRRARARARAAAPSASGRRPRRAHSSPSVSSRPNIRLRFCTACDGGALPQVVDRREDEHPAGRAGRPSTWTRQMLVSRTSRTPGGASASSTNGSSA